MTVPESKKAALENAASLLKNDGCLLAAGTLYE
jgi:hypothetical protein